MAGCSTAESSLSQKVREDANTHVLYHNDDRICQKMLHCIGYWQFKGKLSSKWPVLTTSQEQGTQLSNGHNCHGPGLNECPEAVCGLRANVAEFDRALPSEDVWGVGPLHCCPARARMSHPGPDKYGATPKVCQIHQATPGPPSTQRIRCYATTSGCQGDKQPGQFGQEATAQVPT